MIPAANEVRTLLDFLEDLGEILAKDADGEQIE